MFYAYDTDNNCLGGADNKDTLIKIMADNGLEYDAITDTAPAIPEPTLDELKAQKLAELKQARDNAETLPITTEAGTFDFDDKSRTRLDIALKVLTLSDTTLEWTLADNTTTEVTADDINTIFVNSAIRSNDLHNKYRDLKAQVLEATTSDEVGGINWNK